MSQQPLIFDIVSASCVDGPGIRTVVFLKGCPLKCTWCHNPESQSAVQECFYYSDKCQSCPECKENDCQYNARKQVGIAYPPEALAKMILKNKEYFGPDGGVTFSGGEPLMWPEYLTQVSTLLKRHDINITIDTCGYFKYDKCNDFITNYVDHILFDIKIMDPVKHAEYTGVDNSTIFNNFNALYQQGKSLQPVIPLVPNITATKENLRSIAEFLAAFELPTPKFHPYHSSASAKIQALEETDALLITPKPLSQSEQKRWEYYYKLQIEQFDSAPCT